MSYGENGWDWSVSGRYTHQGELKFEKNANVYKSPVKDNLGERNGECIFRCLEENAKSYDLSEYDYDYWSSRGDRTLGVDPNEVIDLINNSKVFQSEEIVAVSFFDNSRNISPIIDAFQNNKRVLIEFRVK